MKPVCYTMVMLLAILLQPGIASTQSPTTDNKLIKTKEGNMIAIQSNKEVIRKLFEECLNKKDLGLLRELISENYINAQGEKGAAGFERPVGELIQAFPDIQWKLDELISDRDKVVVSWRWEGTHRKSFSHFPATGEKITNEGMAIYTVDQGKITGSKVYTDRLGFLQEIGALSRDLSLLLKRTPSNEHVQFIDKFFVPAAAKKEFYERMSINRAFIKTLPGFIVDAAYEYTDGDGNLICVTVAQWESREALNKAKDTVREEYRKQGFDPAAMFKRLNIVADRGIYSAVGANDK